MATPADVSSPNAALLGPATSKMTASIACRIDEFASFLLALRALRISVFGLTLLRPSRNDRSGLVVSASVGGAIERASIADKFLWLGA